MAQRFKTTTLSLEDLLAPSGTHHVCYRAATLKISSHMNIAESTVGCGNVILPRVLARLFAVHCTRISFFGTAKTLAHERLAALCGVHGTVGLSHMTMLDTSILS